MQHMYFIIIIIKILAQMPITPSYCGGTFKGIQNHLDYIQGNQTN